MADKKISALNPSTTPLAGTEVLPIVQSGSTVQVSVSNLTAGRAMSALSGSFGSGSSAYSIGGTQVSITNASANTYLSIYGGSGATNGGFLLGGNNSENFANIFWSNGSNFMQIATTPVSSKIQFNVEGIVAGDITTAGFAPAAGKGVDFSATANLPGMTSELLNDYEEGTWTPTVTSQTGVIIAYASGGTYTRVGRQVTVTAYVDLTNVGTAGGFLQISNFPYKNGAASSAGYFQQMGIVRETGATGVIYAALINGNATTGVVTSLTGGAVTWSNAYQYAISITYYTA